MQYPFMSTQVWDATKTLYKHKINARICLWDCNEKINVNKMKCV